MKHHLTMVAVAAMLTSPALAEEFRWAGTTEPL